MRILYIIFIFFGTYTVGISQVFPPDIICVDKDTLKWNLPTNTCGPFNSYDIFSSTNFDGPYTLLNSITDPSQTFYFDDNANGNPFFYYILSNHSCPGQVVLSSDTLDNRPPEIAPIQFLTVENGLVRIEWLPSPSPEVNEYIIYRQTIFGLTPIDTVPLVPTTYLDVQSNPEDQSETYFILPLDPCGNTSIFDAPHSTVYLTGEVNSCEQTLNLNWNLYEGWDTEIEEQVLWTSINGFPADPIDTLSASDTSYLVTELDEGNFYCFFIESKRVNSNSKSLSNEHCLFPEIVQPADELILKNVSFTPTNEVEIFWSWNTNAELQTVDILSSMDNADFQIINSPTIGIPLNLNNSYLDTNVDPNAGPVYYQIQTTDDCDSIIISNYGATAFLMGSPNDNLTNLLNWTPFLIENGTTIEYEIHKIVNNIDRLVDNTDGATTTFSDIVDPNNSDESISCYYLVATAEITLPDGTIETVRSRSNTICVEQLSTIYVPNAFVPGGKNSQFKPIVVFPDQVSYLMEIYDRWGQRIFMTTDINEGWRGRKGFREMPMGAYVYHIRIEQPSGRVERKDGSVILIR